MAKGWADYDHAEDLNELDVLIAQELSVKRKKGVGLHEQIEDLEVAAVGLEWWLRYCKCCIFAIPVIAVAALIWHRNPVLAVMRDSLFLEAVVVVSFGFIASRFLHTVQQLSASRIICWEASRQRPSAPGNATRITERLDQLKDTSDGHWWGISLRNPIKTNRLSMLLRERFSKQQLRDLPSGHTV